MSMHDKLNQKHVSKVTSHFILGHLSREQNSAIMKALLKLTSLPKFLPLVVGTKVRISMRNQLAFPICVSVCVFYLS